MRPVTKRITNGLAGVAVAAASVVLAGCTSTHQTGASSTTTTNHVPGSTTTIPYSASLNARTDAQTTSCLNTGGAWVLKGSVTNSAAKTRTYQIVIDFVTVPGSTVLDTKIIYVRNVAHGATQQWSATGAQGKTSMNCVIRQVQAS